MGRRLEQAYIPNTSVGERRIQMCSSVDDGGVRDETKEAGEDDTC